MKVHQCRENRAHAYSAATPVLYSALIYRTPALSLRFFGGMTYKKASLSEREMLVRRVSHGLEDQIENRKCFSAGDGQLLQPIEGVAYYALVQSPIISSGDVCGSVMFLQNKESDRPGDAEQKLIQAAASYLGKQMEL